MKKVLLIGCLFVISFGGAYSQTADPILPSPVLTPGKWHVPSTPLETLCKPGYTSGIDVDGHKVRNVSESLKDQVFKAYGLDPAKIVKHNYEIDHLISLELDGENNIANLWPESYVTEPWNAHKKDTLENRLHFLVCHGSLPLADAQKAISTDWIAAYKQYVGVK